MSADIDTLAEKYLDALNAGEHPDPAVFISQLPYELHQEGERRLRFVDLMHRSRPT